MTQAPLSPGAQTLAWVARSLEEAGQSVDLETQPMPLLVGNTFRGNAGQAASSLETRDLPMLREGVAVGRHAIIVGLLPEVVNARELVDTMRQYRNQCVVGRSALPQGKALDFLLVMVGPRGSEGKDVWKAQALSIERDDRVARKLVWLRPADEASDAESFAAFVKRSFLARPWATSKTFSVASLDEVSSAVEVEEAPRDTAGQWNKLAATWGDEPDALVEKLIEAWKERSAT